MKRSMISMLDGFLLLTLSCCVSQTLRFSLPSYNISVNETYQEGGYPLPPDGFLQVACIDDPSRVPIATVEYSIAGNNSGPFEINSQNGQVSVIDGNVLDYETATSYTFTAMCTDTSNVTIATTAQVSITLLPVNEFQPVVSDSGLTVTLPENTPIGKTLVSTQPGGLGRYSVTDRDDGPDGVITYTLVADQTESASFTLDRVTGSLVLAQSLDVDNTPSGLGRVSVIITACDEDPPRVDCPNIRISLIVLSSNDNNPVFSSERYEVSLPESSPIGTIVATPECTDADAGAGRYQGIKFHSSDGPFVIPDETNGTVILNGMLNYSITPVYNITLICRDTEGRSSIAYLVVNDISSTTSSLGTIAPGQLTSDITTQSDTSGSDSTLIDITTNVPSLRTTQLNDTTDASTTPSSPGIGLILIIVAACVLLLVIVGSSIVCLIFCLHHHKSIQKQTVTVPLEPDQYIEMAQVQSPTPEKQGTSFNNQIYMTIKDSLVEENMYEECRQLDGKPSENSETTTMKHIINDLKPTIKEQHEETDNVVSCEDSKPSASAPSITVSKEVDWSAGSGDGKTSNDSEADIDWGTVTSLPKKSKGFFQRK